MFSVDSLTQTVRTSAWIESFVCLFCCCFLHVFLWFCRSSCWQGQRVSESAVWLQGLLSIRRVMLFSLYSSLYPPPSIPLSSLIHVHFNQEISSRCSSTQFEVSLKSSETRHRKPSSESYCEGTNWCICVNKSVVCSGSRGMEDAL